MKKLFKLLSVLLVAFLMVNLTSCTSKQTIAVVKYGTHTSLDEIEESVCTTILEKLDMNKYEIKKYDCNFNAANIADTMTTIKSSKNVVSVVAIATPVAAVAKSMISDIPVVFAAVSDPKGCSIVENLDTPEANVTGTSDAIDPSKLVDLAYEVKSSTKKLGYIYTASEENSTSNLNKLRAYSKEKGFELVEKTIENSSEITEVANSILDKIDGLIVTDDNNVASAVNVLSEECMKKNVPMYCAADSEIKDGGLIGYSISYTKLGNSTGEMVCDILSEKEIKDIPVKVFDSSELSLYYNSNFLKGSSIEIPSSLLEKAIDLAGNN